MLVFDLDGLLVDSERVYFEGWVKVFEKYQVGIDREEILGWTGKSWTQISQELEEVLGSKEKVLALRNDREQYVYHQLEKGLIDLKPFALETLKLAKEKNLLVALATSTESKRAKAILASHDLIQYFDYLTFGDDVSEHKPNPMVYLKSLQKANIAATDGVAIEDSLAGATAGSRAGMAVFLIPDQSFRKSYSSKEKKDLNILAEGSSLKIVYDYLKKV